MLSRRDFFLMILLFITAFVLFMSVNVGTDLLTQNMSVQPDYRKDTAAFEAADVSLERTALSTAAEERGDTVAIIAPDEASRSWFAEWCRYQKRPYVMFPQLPSAQELAGYPLVLVGDLEIRTTDLPVLRSLVQEKREILFTKLPDYALLEHSAPLRDFFGIRSCAASQLPLESVHILENFFVSGERIYNADAMYDESDKSRFFADYYLLRSGYQIFIQGVPQDAQIDYYDYPALVWQTRTKEADIYVVNTDLFNSKAMMGLISALLAQTRPYYLYPVVDAQTISVLNFPLFASENEEQLQAMYSRSSISLGHDIIWPAVEKILLNYNATPSFFLSPRLDYSGTGALDARMVSFYRRGILKRMGMAGLSMDTVSDTSPADKAAADASFLRENFSGLILSTAFVPREKLDAFLETGSPVYKDISVVVTDYNEDAPLLTLAENGTVVASVTEDGCRHTIADDIRMICMETLLGMNNQAANIRNVLFPESEASTWSEFSNQWSRASTYQKDFQTFDRVSVSQLGRRAANFLSLRYTLEEVASGLRLHIDAADPQCSFLLRLNGQEIAGLTGASYEKITDSAYLLRCTADTVNITLRDTARLRDIPAETLEVFQ